MSYNLKDYAHASRLFVGSNYRLLPKTGFLFHAFIDVNGGTGAYDGANPNSAREIGMLVKQADLPRFTADTKTLHAYNRPNIIQTKIKYDPVTITFHDDSSNVIRNFWVKYYSYYFRDSDYGLSQHNLPYIYTNQVLNNFGLTPKGANHYLRSIRLYSLHQKRFTEYVMVNPIIKSMRFGNHNKQSDSDILQTEMTIEYEAVLYSGGSVSFGNPPGFADLHYDYGRSPIAGLRQISGTNGLFDTKGSTGGYNTAGTAGNFGSSIFNATVGIADQRSNRIYSSGIIDMTNAFNASLRQSANSRVIVPNLSGTAGLTTGPFTGINKNNGIASLASVNNLSLSRELNPMSGAGIDEINQSAVTNGAVVSNFDNSFPLNPGAVADTQSSPTLRLLNNQPQPTTTNQGTINVADEARIIENRIKFIEQTLPVIVDDINSTNEQVQSAASAYNTISQKYNEAKSLPDSTAGKATLLEQYERNINFQLSVLADNTTYYNKRVEELSQLTEELEILISRRDLLT